jgi:hypothetical protein
MAVAHAGAGLGALATGGASIPASIAATAGTLGARAAANRLTGSAVEQVEQHHSIGRRIACNACADGTANGLAFSRHAHGLGGQRAPTGATLCAGARGRVRSVSAPGALGPRC